jgi:hypothetical protein
MQMARVVRWSDNSSPGDRIDMSGSGSGRRAGSVDAHLLDLRQHQFLVTDTQVFDKRRPAFAHPRGMEYVLVGNTGDPATVLRCY